MEPPSRRPFPCPTSRRGFLLQTAATATLGALWWEGLGFEGKRPPPTASDAAPANLEPAVFATLGAMMDRLLPRGEEGEPGARDVDAILYLDAVFGAPDVDPSLLARIREGARKMDAYAGARSSREDAGGAPASRTGAAAPPTFSDLSPDLQDAGLRTLEGTWEDELMLRALLAFTLEAFLGDPVAGANPGAVGWTWADHHPGYPRPESKPPVPGAPR